MIKSDYKEYRGARLEWSINETVHKSTTIHGEQSCGNIFFHNGVVLLYYDGRFGHALRPDSERDLGYQVFGYVKRGRETGGILEHTTEELARVLRVEPRTFILMVKELQGDMTRIITLNDYILAYKEFLDLR